jgi:hypothetical protein
MANRFPTLSDKEDRMSGIYGREFQLWEYRVSHGTLLIRSPANEAMGLQSTVDILCNAVAYLAMPRHIGRVSIEDPNEREVVELRRSLGNILDHHKIFIFVSDLRRHVLVCAKFTVHEFEGDFMRSPLSEMFGPLPPMTYRDSRRQ